MKKYNLETVKTIELQKDHFYILFVPEEAMDMDTAQSLASEIMSLRIPNVVVICKDTKGIKVLDAPAILEEREKFDKYLKEIKF